MQVLGVNLPGGAVALDVNDLVAVTDLGAGRLCSGEELLGQCTEVYVGACLGPRNCNLLGVEVAAFGHQRQLLLEYCVVVGELHVREHVVVLEGLEAALQVLNLDGALCEGHVWDRVDECLRVSQDAVVELVRPELARNLELLINAQSLRNVDATVLFWGVVQLAQRRVAGTSVVPWGGGLQSRSIEALEDHLGPAWLQLAEHSAQGGAHDTGAYEGYIYLIYNLCCLLVGGHLAITSSD